MRISPPVLMLGWARFRAGLASGEATAIRQLRQAGYLLSPDKPLANLANPTPRSGRKFVVWPGQTDANGDR